MKKVRIIAIVIFAFVAALGLHRVSQLILRGQPLNLRVVLSGGAVSPAERALRPNYPYSVIPGGAYSPAELQNSASKDNIVRAHYADFDLKSARVVTLAADRFQYVSYRVKNNVYWTRTKLRIPKGEVLLTDGVNFARTRCGNRLSNVPHQQYSVPAPPTKALSLPPFSPKLLASGEVSLPPAPTLAELPETLGLAFDLPGVAPYVPPAPPIPGNTAENWPPVYVIPPPSPITPGLPFMAVPPNTPGSPNTPLIPSTPATPIPPGIPPPPPITAEVPEPSSLYLFLVAFALSLWVLTRLLRDDSQPAKDAKEDGN